MSVAKNLGIAVQSGGLRRQHALDSEGKRIFFAMIDPEIPQIEEPGNVLLRAAGGESVYPAAIRETQSTRYASSIRLATDLPMPILPADTHEVFKTDPWKYNTFTKTSLNLLKEHGVTVLEKGVGPDKRWYAKYLRTSDGSWVFAQILPPTAEPKATEITTLLFESVSKKALVLEEKESKRLSFYTRRSDRGPSIQLIAPAMTTHWDIREVDGSPKLVKGPLSVPLQQSDDGSYLYYPERYANSTRKNKPDVILLFRNKAPTVDEVNKQIEKQRFLETETFLVEDKSTRMNLQIKAQYHGKKDGRDIFRALNIVMLGKTITVLRTVKDSLDR